MEEPSLREHYVLVAFLVKHLTFGAWLERHRMYIQETG